MSSQTDSSNTDLPTNLSSLPDDPSVLRDMILSLTQELQKSNSLIEHLQHQLDQHLRHRFGRRSETIDWENSLFSKDVIEAMLSAENDKSKSPSVNEVISYERKKPAKKGHGRQVIPEHLPRVRDEIDIPESEKICSVCNTPKILIREEISEQLEYKPASLFVKQTVRPVYACKQKHEVSVAPAPASPIEKGLAGPGLLAQIAISKYADHLPLNRQEDILAREGVHIPRSTQCDWMKRCAQLLYLLYEQMCATVLSANVIHTDDTPVEVQHKKKTKKGRVWVYEDPARMLAVFDYTPNRSREGPTNFLEDFSGYLQADAYPGYDKLYANDSITEVACWAHTRRKFYDSRTVQPEVAMCGVAWIKQLYDVERMANDYRDALSPELPEANRRELYVQKRYELRQEYSVELLQKIGEWLEEQEKVFLPKSPVGQAISYAQSNWAALNVYVTNGELSIDNNIAERAMRHVVSGRKNWLFFGNDRGGQTWAVITSLLYTAKLHKLNLFEYLSDVLSRIGDTPISKLEQFIPDIWKREHVQSKPEQVIASYRAHNENSPAK